MTTRGAKCRISATTVRRASSVLCRCASGEPGIPSFRDTQDLGRLLSLGGAQRGTASGAALAGREVENAGAVAGLDGLGQGTGAGQLDVVAMCGDGQDVYGHGEPDMIYS